MKRLLPVLLTGALVFYWPTNGSVLMFVAAVFYLIGSRNPHQVKAGTPFIDNHEPAKRQNEAASKMRRAAQMSAGAAAMQSTMPMGYGSGMQRQQMAQQAAWTNQAAAMEMADAADMMMDAADSRDPFSY